MNRSLYHRPNLSATRQGLPWAEEVGEWLDQLEDWLEDRNEAGEAARAHDLLALRGKLRRVDPEKLQTLDTQGTVPRVEREIAANEGDLLKQALGVIDLEGWREELATLNEALEAGKQTNEDAVAWACELLDELDDAELIWQAARRAGTELAGLREKLDECIREMVCHGDLFLHAGPLVQILAWTLRPDLETHDADLGATARKLVYLLDMIEEAEADLAPLSPWPLPPTLDKLRLSIQEETAIGLIPERQFQPAMGANPAQRGKAIPSCKWSSQDRKQTARLDIPTCAPENGKLYLEFTGAGLVGQPVLLGGLRGVIEELGGAAMAVFDWDDVRDVETQLHVLRVGSREWQQTAGLKKR